MKVLCIEVNASTVIYTWRLYDKRGGQEHCGSTGMPLDRVATMVLSGNLN